MPEHVRPPLIGELEQRVEEALATARASEAAMMSVGAAAIDAAEQARRAAELAEHASVAAIEARDAVFAAAAANAAGPELRGKAEAEDEGLGDFSARADRLVERLRRLQRVPLGGPAASGPAASPRFAG